VADDETPELPRPSAVCGLVDAPKVEGASEGAAEVIAAIAHELQRQLSGMATFDLVYGVGKVADLTVEPANQSASPLSVVGVGTGFAISLKQVFERSTTAREDANGSTRH